MRLETAAKEAKWLVHTDGIFRPEDGTSYLSNKFWTWKTVILQTTPDDCATFDQILPNSEFPSYQLLVSYNRLRVLS